MIAGLALIPYYDQPAFDLGFGTIYGWGLMVAIGFLSGAWYCARRAQQDGLDPRVSFDFALWVFVGGFIGAHLVHVLFYEPEMLDRDPMALFYIWDGVSSFGGFLGAFVTTIAFFRLRRASFFQYADSLALGFTLAWAIARIGCFLAHDHVGTKSDFFLAVNFPDGPRHDLGLYESIFTWFLFAVMWTVGRSRPPAGTLAGILVTGYAIPRYLMEDLRAFDARYYGLTPAQFGAFALFALGLFILWRSRSSERPPYGSPASSPPPEPAPTIATT